MPRRSPAVFAFGNSPEIADDRLTKVLRGAKTATSSALPPGCQVDDLVPRLGSQDIVLNGAGEPAAIIETEAFAIKAFTDVDASHAIAEGYASLNEWRRFKRDMYGREGIWDEALLILCERFRLVRAFGKQDGIQGLSHLTFIVRDLDKMTRIITEVLAGEEVYSSGDKTFSTSREKFFVAGGLWIAIMEGDGLPTRTYNHVAFKVTDEQLEKAKSAIQRLGVDMRPPRPRVDGEGQSLYFYDHDNHLFELHTGTLEERLARYRGD